jgi:hypothetical protein
MHRAALIATTLASFTLLSSASAQSRVPNSIKYKDSGVQAAKGHSASAAIEARALLNSDATTDVEVTTGSFDDGATAGTISKVKVWIPTAGGEVPRNFNHLDADGTFSGSITGVIPTDTLRIDAHVTNAGTPGTEVVAASATVARRPDLEVFAVSGPGVAVTGTLASVRGYIRELNGDLGARTNVKLLIDGQEVDRAENVWVNAGGQVAVTFATVIQVGAGRHDFTVVAEAVRPGDWDLSNNTKTANNEVFNELDEFYSWNASASEQQFDFYSYQKRPWTETTRDEHGLTQSFSFRGVIRAAVNLDSITASASGQSDSHPLFDYTTTEFSSFRTPIGTDCRMSWSSNPEVIACFDPEDTVVTVQSQYGVADAVYRSYGWATRQHPFAPEEPMFTWDTTREEHGLQSRFGSTVALRYTLNDGTNEWTTEPFFPSLSTKTRVQNQPYRCVFDDFTNEQVCQESRSTTTTRQGSASGFAQ